MKYGTGDEEVISRNVKTKLHIPLALKKKYSMLKWPVGRVKVLNISRILDPAPLEWAVKLTGDPPLPGVG